MLLNSWLNCPLTTLTSKPGSHIQSTYLGHHYSIREQLLLNHNLSKALTTSLPAEFSWVQLRRQASGCQRWRYFMWPSLAEATYSRTTIWSIFTGGIVEHCGNSMCMLRQFKYLDDPWKMCQGPTGTVRQTLSVPTGDYVAGRWARYENQA